MYRTKSPNSLCYKRFRYALARVYGLSNCVPYHRDPNDDLPIPISNVICCSGLHPTSNTSTIFRAFFLGSNSAESTRYRHSLHSGIHQQPWYYVKSSPERSCLPAPSASSVDRSRRKWRLFPPWWTTFWRPKRLRTTRGERRPDLCEPVRFKRPDTFVSLQQQQPSRCTFLSRRKACSLISRLGTSRGCSAALPTVPSSFFENI
jgi:hypothetical protein